MLDEAKDAAIKVGIGNDGLPKMNFLRSSRAPNR
jgi:hypothetical protein